VTFPQTALPQRTDFLINGTWVNVSSDVRYSDGITIIQGGKDEGSRTDPGSMTFKLNNRSGDYTDRNPMSQYYGLIGRNTQVRHSVACDGVYCLVPSFGDNYVSAADTAALDITGDIEVQIDCVADWFYSNDQLTHELISKYNTGLNQRSWGLGYFNGYLFFSWSPDGTLASTIVSASTAPMVPNPSTGRAAIKVTLDVNNGAAGNTVTFYTSDTISGSWTQLGAAVVTAGVTSIFSSTADLHIGHDPTANSYGRLRGKVYAAKVLNGIGGAAVANPDFTAQAAGATSFGDAAGRPWVLHGTGIELTDKLYRFWGEIPSWPQSWSGGGIDHWASISAAGILRRLGTGRKPLKSAMRRGLESLASGKVPVFPQAGVLAYWPCEDADGATSVASGMPSGGYSMSFTGSPTIGSYSGFVSTDPIITMNTGVFSGRVKSYTSTGQTSFAMALNAPAGTTSNVTMFQFFTTGTAYRWELLYNSGSSGSIRLRAYDNAGNNLLDDTQALGIDSKLIWLTLELTQNGGNVDYTTFAFTAGNSVSVLDSGTVATATVGVVQNVKINPNGNASGVSFGHLILRSSTVDIPDIYAQVAAWAGFESAASRIMRLCYEEGIEVECHWNDDDTESMGAQLPGKLVDLLQECVDVDTGLLYETRDFFGIGYRTRKSLYEDLFTGWTLGYSDSELSGFSPIEDDLNIHNDITVSRPNGSSARSTLLSGRLSTLDPPNGIGAGYDVQVDRNANLDSRLQDLADWMLHLYTADEARFPSLPIQFQRDQFNGAHLSFALNVKRIGIGDMIILKAPPVTKGWPPDRIYLILRGYEEFLSSFQWEMDYSCMPGKVYNVAVLNGTNNAVARLGSDASTLHQSYNSAATSLLVDCTDYQLWTTAGGDFPFDVMISGEQITISGIAGAASPQTFTVSARAVNGVSKTLPSGAKVDLYLPTYIGL
jgi:hypothetical protein